MPSVVVYETANGRKPLSDYFKDLEKNNKTDELARIILHIEYLKKLGMQINNEYPHSTRKIKDDLFELRIDAHRVFFFSFVKNQIVLLHAFTKKSNKTPKKEIDKAFAELRDHKRRNKSEQ